MESGNIQALRLSAHPRRIGGTLVALGCVSSDQLEEGLSHRVEGQERLGECLVRLGHCEPGDILNALSEQYGVEICDLDEEMVAREVIDLLPAEFAQSRNVLPLSVDQGLLRIATTDPGNAVLQDEIRLVSGLDVEVVLAPANKIGERIRQFYELTVERMVEDLHDVDSAVAPENLHDIEVMASEPTVVNLVNLIISSAVKERASDVHLTPFEGAIELRYRIDGVLIEMPPPPKHLHAAIISRIKIMADMNIAERYLPQDGRIQIQHSSKRVDIRVGSMPTVYGESIVMRLLEKGGQIKTLPELGLDNERHDRLLHSVLKPHGIFLATGPTGSGKTTSLYSILSSIYSVEKKILTIEDPVEYELPGVAQIPVRPGRGFTFATGLRAILRQDPDVIMVGEIRDTETAEIAVRAALTGHLVFSTLHTNDAAGAVTRLIDMGVEPFLLASSLEGVLAQRLVRRICSICREESELRPDLRLKAEAAGLDLSSFERFYHGAGCDDCRQSGYRGRVGLYELMVIDNNLRNRIQAGGSSAEIRAEAGMRSIRDDGLLKAREGETTVEEVLRVSVDSEG